MREKPFGDANVMELHALGPAEALKSHVLLVRHLLDHVRDSNPACKNIEGDYVEKSGMGKKDSPCLEKDQESGLVCCWYLDLSSSRRWSGQV